MDFYQLGGNIVLHFPAWPKSYFLAVYTSMVTSVTATEILGILVNFS